MSHRMSCSITVLYNTEASDFQNIRSYYDLVDRVIILDNSVQNHEDEITSLDRDQKITYRSFGENVGLVKALNYGMRLAAEWGCAWALLMDADSVVTTPLTSIYENYLRQNKQTDRIAVLAPIHITDRSKGRKHSFPKQVKWAMTSGCFYNVDIFEKVGGFMEALFVDGLDMDYGYRVSRGGIELSRFPRHRYSMCRLRPEY